MRSRLDGAAMCGLSLIQPWATLIAVGAKRFETRNWLTNYRGPVAIHASRWTNDAEEICQEERYAKLLAKHGYLDPGDLPWGAVVATAQLVACHRTSDLIRPRHPLLTHQEFDLGDFSLGRFAFELVDVVRLAEPVRQRGYPGFWPVDDALLSQLLGKAS